MAADHEHRRRHAFVWVWLPGATAPVVAGRVVDAATRGGPEHLVFAYGQSYLARADAIAIFTPELPLRAGAIEPRGQLSLAGCLRDACPDAWGRRVILAREHGRLGVDDDTGDLDELSYMLRSGTERIGALDFQASPSEYVARDESADLASFVVAADALQAGDDLPAVMAEALVRGTSIGGARPKVILKDGPRHLIAKLSTSTDVYPVVKAEAAAMFLAREVGLDVARCEFTRSVGRDVLLVERFDRTSVPGQRRLIVSALTILGLHEMQARHASYTDLADAIRAGFSDPTADLRELFARMVFNVCVGNTDDHLRNHAAFWDGESLSLTPAYDLCPQPRSGETATQAIDIGRTPGQRASQLRLCRLAAPAFHLTTQDADSVIEAQVETIRARWADVADEARLTTAERDQMWGRQILNPYITYDQA